LVTHSTEIVRMLSVTPCTKMEQAVTVHVRLW